MEKTFSFMTSGNGLGRVGLQTLFDAERDTPDLIDMLAEDVPYVRDLLASLRAGIPLVPHSRVGQIGDSGFFRLPNHYRSVSYILPSVASERPGPGQGVIVFKGTEPLIDDFPEYFGWMLETPFRSGALPMALHFPLDMKLPPSAMWIEECITEQAVSSRLQQLYIRRYKRLARLPVPLFVFSLTPQQNARYEEVIRGRLPEDAMKKIKNKLADGLGVEVYYYPDLPVRVADLAVWPVRERFKAALGAEQVEKSFNSWAQLMAEMLCLNYMPYVPWHHGMGGCVDPGNVCIDGGFNDLLTLVPFDAIPDVFTFRHSIQASITMLASSMTTMAAAAIGIPNAPDSGAMDLAATYITERLRQQIRATERGGHLIDERLSRSLDPPDVADIVAVLRKLHNNRTKSAHFVGNGGSATVLLGTEGLSAVVRL